MKDRIETEATILDVTDDAKWKYSVEAEIPAFDGDRSYRFLAWNKSQGPPPQIGATGMATFEPYQRAKFYVERGDIEAGPVDGTETHYHVTWNMVGFSEGATGATNGAAPTHSTPSTPKTAVRGAQSAVSSTGVTYLPAPTPAERLAKELAKFRREIEGVNDRKAVSDILAMVEPGVYTLDGLIQDAEKLANWYNERMVARLVEQEAELSETPPKLPPTSPLVEAAEDMGAVVTSVEEIGKMSVQDVKNRPDLGKFVKEQQFRKEDISRVIQDAGYADSAAYLTDSGNSVQGLAQLLNDALGAW